LPTGSRLDAIAHACHAYLERIPEWRLWLAVFALGVVVGLATGHALEATLSTLVFLGLLAAIIESVKWISRRRQLRKPS
jgi:hypothetical protein